MHAFTETQIIRLACNPLQHVLEETNYHQFILLYWGFAFFSESNGLMMLHVSTTKVSQKGQKVYSDLSLHRDLFFFTDFLK